MYYSFQKSIDDVQSFFITITVAKSKRTKTYPRIRGTFTLQKENTIDYIRYLDLRTRRLMDVNGTDAQFELDIKQLREFWKLYDTYAHRENLFYFVFDVKRESHCRIECVVSSQQLGVGRRTNAIGGAYWKNEIYKDMMKDQNSLRTLRNAEVGKLFDKEWFWDAVLSEYIFAILKL